MNKESAYELQLIDCNCNECIFMARDSKTYKKWFVWSREMLLADFTRAKAKAISDAEKVVDDKSRAGMLRVARKMNFQFDATGLIHYGYCEKLKKKVSFIPVTCQIDTQKCFVHRRQKPLAEAKGDFAHRGL